MSDRLTDLQRQRALAQEQLAWFDREIARESGGKITTPAAAIAALRAPAAAETPATETEAEKILARYRHTARPVSNEVKRGCFLYFLTAFGLLIMALTAFWLLHNL